MTVGQKRAGLACTISMGLSVLSIGLAVYVLASRPAAEQRAYDRLVAETADSLRPLYRDFGIKESASPPRTIGEALMPLLQPIERTNKGAVGDPWTPPLGERQQWRVGTVKVWLARPSITARVNSGGRSVVVHAWAANENDFNVPMMRLDEGDTLYAATDQELQTLKSLGPAHASHEGN